LAELSGGRQPVGPQLTAGHGIPEFLQAIETIFWLVAGNNRRIDAAD